MLLTYVRSNHHFHQNRGLSVKPGSFYFDAARRGKALSTPILWYLENSESRWGRSHPLSQATQHPIPLAIRPRLPGRDGELLHLDAPGSAGHNFVAALDLKLDAWLREIPEAPRHTPSPQQAELLRSLGYLE